MRHCVLPLVHGQTSTQCLWRFATMTCIRLDCHNDRPQAILLMRLIFIMCSFILRFICFLIGASCSARFNPQCMSEEKRAKIFAHPLIHSDKNILIFFSLVNTQDQHFLSLQHIWTFSKKLKVTCYFVC
jgi:hypothetical protein